MADEFAAGGVIPGSTGPENDRAPSSSGGCTQGGYVAGPANCVPMTMRRLTEPDEHGCCQVSINGGAPEWLLSAKHPIPSQWLEAVKELNHDR